MSEQRHRPSTAGSTLRGLMSAVGLIALIYDLTPMALYGHLERWYQAYFGAIERLRAMLFGWAEHLPLGLDRYFGVTPLEAHLIVVLLLLTVSMVRAVMFSFIDDALAESPPLFARYPFLLPLIPGLCTPLYVAILGGGMLVFPAWFTLPFYGLIVLLVLVMAHAPPGMEVEEAVEPALLRREIYAVLAWVVVIVALNYSVFSWI